MVEVAGPSAAQQVRAVSELMLHHDADQVLIDGAIDRRAASAPDVCDGLVMATGAVLGERDRAGRDPHRRGGRARAAAVAGGRTRDGCGPRAGARRNGQPAGTSSARRAPGDQAPSEELPAPLRPACRRTPRSAELVPEHAAGSYLADRRGRFPSAPVGGANVGLRRRRSRSSRSVVAGDPTRVFLSSRGIGWYRRQQASELMGGSQRPGCWRSPSTPSPPARTASTRSSLRGAARPRP